MDVLIRQAHPGPDVPAYQTFEQKTADARAYQEQENIAWPVLVDDLEGTTHQVYGGLADPIYLIGTDGRVSYYNMWTHAPTVHDALESLIARGGSGIVRGAGVDRFPHMGAAMTDGWRGLRRGLPQSFVDMETAVPTQGVSTFLGYQLRPLLAPLTLRARPLPVPVKVGLVVGAGAAALLFLRSRRKNNG